MCVLRAVPCAKGDAREDGEQLMTLQHVLATAACGALCLAARYLTHSLIRWGIGTYTMVRPAW